MDSDRTLAGPPPLDLDDLAVPGRRIGPYRLVRELGRGGMGTVFLAVRDDAAYEKLVALKLVRVGGSEELVGRFRRERQILAGLEHPNIARLLDGGSAEDGTPYLVMEYVEGEPIDRWCDRQALEPAARVKLFRKVCDAVQHAHARLVVHRDLKPSNILVTADGKPKLLDFGIAKLVGPAERRRARCCRRRSPCAEPRDGTTRRPRPRSSPSPPGPASRATCRARRSSSARRSRCAAACTAPSTRWWRGP